MQMQKYAARQQNSVNIDSICNMHKHKTKQKKKPKKEEEKDIQTVKEEK